jgi:hypothetical protein
VKDSGDKVMKVKEYLRSNIKKCGATRKASAAASWMVHNYRVVMSDVTDVYARFYSCRECLASKCRGL